MSGNTDAPAYANPSVTVKQWSDGNEYHQTRDGSPGLTKRELIAAMAMQGILSGDSAMATDPDNAAYHAMQHADALLKRLEP